jgi:hypothetical protein
MAKPPVIVIEGSSKAVPEPLFIIQDGETFWVTKALWGYDPGGDEEEQRGYDGVRDNFKRATEQGTYTAARLDTSTAVANFIQTNPPRK